MLKSPLNGLLKIKYPILQAPIGAASTPELAAAVSNAGGLGSLALSWNDTETVRQSIRKTRELTSQPFAVNFVLAFDQQERIRICIEEHVPIVTFFWGDSTKYIRLLKDNGISVAQTVGNVQEALLYEKNGIDFLIAQGWEAGGHVWGNVASSVLIPAVTRKVQIPVVAAGGIASGAGILSAMALGASGVSIGTRFLVSPESAASPVYKRAIIEADENSTVYLPGLFNIGWDLAPHRVVRNTTVSLWEGSGRPDSPGRPGEGEIVAYGVNNTPVLKYSDAIPVHGMTGNLEALALYAGQSSGIIDQEMPVKDIIAGLVSEFKTALQRLNGL